MAIYATAPDLADWLAEADFVAYGAQLALAVEAASRAIDRACNRRFDLAAPQVRYYTAEFDRHLGQWYVEIDDVQTTVGLIVETDGTPEATVTNYVLTPINPNGRPWTRIEFLPGAAVNGTRHGVKVTGRFGWTTVPDSIKLAVLIQAGRLFARRESSSGPLSSLKVDDVAYAWAASDLDADVAAAVAPYKRVWSVA